MGIEDSKITSRGETNHENEERVVRRNELGRGGAGDQGRRWHGTYTHRLSGAVGPPARRLRHFQAMGRAKRVIELAQEDKEIKRSSCCLSWPWAASLIWRFPGTISVRRSIMREYYQDIAESLIKQGIMKFIWMIGHSGNMPPLIDAGRELKDKYGALTVLDRCWISAREHKGPRTPAEVARGGHASGSVALPELPEETLKRVLPQRKVWLAEGRPIYGWGGVDDFVRASLRRLPWYPHGQTQDEPQQPRPAHDRLHGRQFPRRRRPLGG